WHGGFCDACRGLPAVGHRPGGAPSAPARRLAKREDGATHGNGRSSWRSGGQRFRGDSAPRIEQPTDWDTRECRTLAGGTPAQKGLAATADGAPSGNHRHARRAHAGNRAAAERRMGSTVRSHDARTGPAPELVAFQLLGPNNGPGIWRGHRESILEGICWNKLVRH